MSHWFSGSLQAEQKHAEKNVHDSSKTGRELLDEENPGPMAAGNEWEADDDGYFEPQSDTDIDTQGAGEPTSFEAQQDLCTCQKRWKSPKLPSIYLPEVDRKTYLEEGVALYKAIVNGYSANASLILRRNPKKLLFSSITERCETALHVAVEARQAAVVKDLTVLMVKHRNPKGLEMQNEIGNTAFCVAVAAGSVEIAEILMEGNLDLSLLRGADNKTPLNIAADNGHADMIRFIYHNFKNGEHLPHLDEEELAEIFLACIHVGLFDLAIELLNFCGNLAWACNGDNEEGALGILARMPSAFTGKTTSRTLKALKNQWYGGSDTISTRNKAFVLTELLWQTMLSDEEKPFEETIKQTSKLLFEAARLGNYNFLTVLISSYPQLILKSDENKGSLFHVAVSHRQASIFKQIYKIGLWKDEILMYKVKIVDDNKESQANDNILHLAAKLPSSDCLSKLSGAALQMQWELQWFKEVEKMMPQSEKERRDSKDKLTPRELFTKEHCKLRNEGEEWMKNTAQSCMIVATLVTAVVFTVTSSLPGGNDGTTGTPMNINKSMFHVFSLASTVALYSSIISTLMFLSIFTSRYAEDDFLVSLPLRLAAGITTLLFSTMGMMVSFAAILFLAYDRKHEMRWVPILASAMSVFSVVTVFVFQYQVVRDVLVSTFGSRYLFRPFSNSKFWGAQL